MRLRDEFLSIASHELRTPLTALDLSLELRRGMAKSPASAPPKALDALSARRNG